MKIFIVFILIAMVFNSECYRTDSDQSIITFPKTNGNFTGDLCQLSTGQKGICKTLNKCIYALGLLKLNLKPQHCGFESSTPIVCCPLRIPLTSSNKTPKQRQIIRKNSEDQCQFPSGEEGLCVKLEECNYAIKLLKSNERPQNCGFDEFTPLVCCPIELPNRFHLERIDHASKCYEYNTQKDTISPNFPLIINGEFAEKAEFPHMALLGYNNKENIKWLCGGSLISKDYILTAAHCLYHEPYGQVKYIRLGELDFNNTMDGINPEDYGIRNVTPHPKYTASSHYNDIALIQLDREVKFTPQVKPACLHPDNTTPSPLIVTGWGQTAYFDPQSSHLLKAVVYPTNSTACKKAYGIEPKLRRGVLDDLQFCAGYEGRDACPGDSGGPIQVKNYFSLLKRYYFSIVGITSFGKACGYNNAGGYTKIFGYISWIEDIVWNDSR